MFLVTLVGAARSVGNWALKMFSSSWSRASSWWSLPYSRMDLRVSALCSRVMGRYSSFAMAMSLPLLLFLEGANGGSCLA